MSSELDKEIANQAHLAGQSIGLQRRAVAAFLNRVIDDVKPALRAMSERVEIARIQSMVGVTSDSAGFRGVDLWGWSPTGLLIDKEKVEFHRTRQGISWCRDGELLGIILTDHGDLVLARYAYSESRDAISWRATYSLLTAANVVEYVNSEIWQVFDRICRALRRAAEASMATRAAEINSQADRIAAAVRLLRTR